MKLAEVIKNIYNKTLINDPSQGKDFLTEIQFNEDILIIDGNYFSVENTADGNIKLEKKDILLEKDDPTRIYIDKSINIFKDITGEDLKMMDEIINSETITYNGKIFKDNPYKNFVVKLVFNNGEMTVINNNPQNGPVRKASVIGLFQNAVDYYKKYGILFPNTEIYLMVTDIYSYYFQNLPFWSMVSPVNHKKILYPFDNFYNNRINDLNIDDIRRKIEERRITHPNKQNVIYFRGANTDTKFGGIREYLSKVKTKEIPLQVIINKNYGPTQDMWEFQDYKYLIDIGGHQPWSYRFFYLPLMKSVIFKIETLQFYENAYNLEWKSLTDYNLEEGVDYISIKFNYVEGDENNNFYERKKVLRELISWYHFFENNPDKYQEMAESCYNKWKKYTMDKMSQYIYYSVDKYAKIIGNKSLI